MNNKLALITGATSGIGYETAILLAKNNFDLILTGRRKERLENLKINIEKSTNSKVKILTFDIRNRIECENELNKLDSEFQQIDLLINNAGLAAGSATIYESEIDDWDNMIDTNIKGLVYITRIVSAWMVSRGSGQIINISSIAGKEPYPNGSVYCGTKHAVSAITKAMRIELLKYGIKVSSIAPGAVNTEFSTIRFKGDKEKAEAVYMGFKPLTGKDIAEVILFVIQRPPHVNIDDILVMPTSQGSARDIYRN